MTTTPILFASHNVDKFRLFGALVRQVENNRQVISLADLGIEDTSPETVEVMRRARMKLDFYTSEVKRSGYTGISCIVCVDDNIIIPSDDSVPTDSLNESWVATETLLSGGVPDRSPVVVQHSFAYSNQGFITTGVARVMFEYVAPSIPIPHTKNTYPLIGVLARPGESRTFSSQPFEAIVDHYLAYTRGVIAASLAN